MHDGGGLPSSSLSGRRMFAVSRRLSYGRSMSVGDSDSASSQPSAPFAPRARSFFEAIYCGFSVLDAHYSRPMLPWIVAETRLQDEHGSQEAVVLRVKDDCVLAISHESQQVLFRHSAADIIRYCRCRQEPQCFAYLIRSPSTPLTCHVFLAVRDTQIVDLFYSIRHGCDVVRSSVVQSRKSSDPSAVECSRGMSPPSDAFCSTTSPSEGRASPFSSVLDNFEVLFIGRVELPGKRPSDDFVDNAVERFHRYKCATLKAVRFSDSADVKQSGELEMRKTQLDDDVFHEEEEGQISAISEICVSSESACPSIPEEMGKSLYSTTDCTALKGGYSRAMLLLIGSSDIRTISLENKKTLLTRKLCDICRMMKGGHYSDHVAFVCRATENTDSFVAYIFKCQSDDIAQSVMHAVRCAFQTAAAELEGSDSSKATTITGGDCTQHCCPFCPMEQFARLCADVEGMGSAQVYEVLLQRVAQLDSADQEQVLMRFNAQINARRNQLYGIPENENEASVQGVSSRAFHCRNVLMMAQLRSLCEAAQRIHEPDPACMKGRRLNLLDQRRRSTSGDGLSKLMQLGGRAKRSFSVSLDTIGRKLSKNELLTSGGIHSMDQFARQQPLAFVESVEITAVPATPESTTTTRYYFETPDGRLSPSQQPTRRHTVGAQYHQVDASASNASSTNEASPRSPTKPNGLPKSLLGGTKTPIAVRGSVDMASRALWSKRRQTPTTADMGRRMSWRQAIFQRTIISPHSAADSSSPERQRHSQSSGGRAARNSVASSLSGLLSDHDSRRGSALDAELLLASDLDAPCTDPLQKARHYKALWRKAITQQILNNRLQEHSDLKEKRRAAVNAKKLDYEELIGCSSEELDKMWAEMLDHPSRSTHKFDRVKIEDAVRAGVPRHLRSSVWKFLMEQHFLDKSKQWHNEDVPPHNYGDLLKQLTAHQHAILIDLGRTFPTHPYFTQHLGPGQLSLFNILKAYSLFDAEVGYCQGLSFIAGTLLLHMEDEEAFDMFLNMMYRFGFRKQYRPDMMALQIQMYQLSRLIHDRHLDLHQHLEDYEIPALYAAPWFLTLFASTFPLGFVVRVLDLIFLSGDMDVVFTIALVLLGEHKELIKHCSSFESINEFLKTTLPAMSIIQMERVFNAVFEMDLSRQLLGYEIEYQVIQDEMAPTVGGLSGVPLSPTGSSPPLASSPSLPPADSLLDATADDGELAEHIMRLQNNNRYLKRQNAELTDQLRTMGERIAVLEMERSNTVTQLRDANVTIAAFTKKFGGLTLKSSPNEGAGVRRPPTVLPVGTALAPLATIVDSSSPDDSGVCYSSSSHSGTDEH